LDYKLQKNKRQSGLKTLSKKALYEFIEKEEEERNIPSNNSLPVL
jgi:hypothetical protein